MAYFRCTTGGSGKGNTLVVTCADDLAGATITCTNGTKTYTKTCPSTAPYEVTFYGLAAGTYTVSATVSGNTYTTTVVITDYEAALGGFNWKTWVDLSENYTSSDFTDLDDLLSDETAIRELMTIHACVDYLADIATTSADVETIIGNDLCAKWINNRDYALDTLYANTIIADYMDEADKYFYGEWVITDNTTTPPTWGAKGNVPIMTANNAPYGTASASSEYNANNAAWKAFNGDLSNWWSCTQDQTNPNITYKFTNPTAVKRVRHWQNESGGCSCKIRYSDDGITFTDVEDSQYTTIVNGWVTKDISNVGYHLYWNVYFNNLTNHFSSSNIQFYGRELSVSVPKMGTNTTPYGEASATNVYSYGGNSFPAYLAFDGVDSTRWIGTSFPNTIYYEFPSAVAICMIAYKGEDAGNLGKDIALINGDNNDEVIQSFVTVNQAAIQMFTVDNPIVAQKYGLKITTAWGGASNSVAKTLQFYGKDYSEKEFEEGTTKKWLYDHGVELETLAPFTSFYGNSNGSIDKQDSVIKVVSCTPQYSGWGIGANIDLSDYDVMRMKVGNAKLPPSTTSIGLRIYSSAVASSSSFVADSVVSSGSSDIPNNIGLGISSINQTEYAYASIGNNSNTSNPDWFELKELWLE